MSPLVAVYLAVNTFVVLLALKKWLTRSTDDVIELERLPLLDLTMRVDHIYDLKVERVYVTEGKLHFVGLYGSLGELAFNVHDVEIVGPDGKVGMTWSTLFGWPGWSCVHLDLPLEGTWDGQINERG